MALTESGPPGVPARWPGECGECGYGFDTGDLIVSDDAGGWNHGNPAECEPGSVAIFTGDQGATSRPAPPRADRFDGTTLDDMGY